MSAARSRWDRVAVAFAVAAALALAPPPAAAQQDDERRIERQVLVVGPESHRRILLERLAHRGFLGVELLDLTPELRQHFGGSDDRGLLVAGVEPDSPAAAAGLRVGDMITAIDGRPLRSAGQLVVQIGRRGQGTEVELELWRDGRRQVTRAVLAEREREQLELGQFLWRQGEGGPGLLELGGDGARQVITVDPEAINESVRELVERLEARGLPGLARLEVERRQQLEQRIQELERRLLEMERQLGRRGGDDD